MQFCLKNRKYGGLSSLISLLCIFVVGVLFIQTANLSGRLVHYDTA